MMRMLDKERKREIHRQQIIKSAPDELTREELKLQFIIDRDNAAKEIKGLAKKHRIEIESVFSSR
jgi:hypothetical protein